MKGLLISMAVFALCGTAGYTQNLLLNGSFELPVIAAGTSSEVIAIPWQGNVTPNIQILSGSYGVPEFPGPQDGQQYVAINGGAALSQAFTITTAGTYVLSWFDNAGNHTNSSPYSVTVNSGAGVVASTTLDASHFPSWVSHSIQLNLNPDTYTVSLQSRGPAFGLATLIDNVVLVGPPPTTCQPGLVFQNVGLPEIFIPLDPKDKKCPAQIRFAPLGLNFSVQSTTEPGALCEAKSNTGTLTMLLVCPDGQETVGGFSTTEATLTLFEDGTLRWRSAGFEVVTPLMDISFGKCDFPPITDFIDTSADLGLNSATTPFETIVRAAEPVFHERLSAVVETSSCLKTWWGNILKKVAKSFCDCKNKP